MMQKIGTNGEGKSTVVTPAGRSQKKKSVIFDFRPEVAVAVASNRGGS